MVASQVISSVSGPPDHLTKDHLTKSVGWSIASVSLHSALHRPELNLRAERTKPYGLKSSPEGALSSQRGDSFPHGLEKLAPLGLSPCGLSDHLTKDHLTTRQRTTRLSDQRPPDQRPSDQRPSDHLTKRDLTTLAFCCIMTVSQ
jgi:hypothetical protein